MKDGKIEENWRDIAISKLNKLIPNAGRCGNCGGVSTVAIQNDIVTPVGFNTTTTTMDIFGNTNIYPQVMLCCHRCGHTRFFNYVVLSQDESTPSTITANA